MGGFSVLFFVFFIFIIYQWISTYIKNENSPIIATKAQLIKKIRSVSTSSDGNGGTSTSESLMLKFQLDTGSEIKLNVGSRIFRSISEYEWGTLTFQGTRFIRFESSSGIIAK